MALTPLATTDLSLANFSPTHFAPILPKEVLYILKTLHKAGYEAYIVGGCVRDMILCEMHHWNKIPHDYDITTSALPKQVMELFAHTIPTGLKYGTVSVLINKQSYEVTTFRVDGDYSNLRAPDSISFSRSLLEDIKRRDFSINALAYSIESGLVDEVNGVQDLQRGIIACVGDAFLRFNEDALRILRALRFASQLGFSIQAHTKDAICALAPNLKYIASERIRVELTKMLCGQYAHRILREFKEQIAIVAPVQNAQNYQPHSHPKLAWAAFLHNIDIGECREVLGRLKFDNKTKRYILTLLAYYDMSFSLSPLALRRMLVALGGRGVPNALEEINAKNIMRDICVLNANRAGVEAFRALVLDTLHSSLPLSLKELAINGTHLAQCGIAGRQIGKMLSILLDEVLQERLENTPHALISRVLRLKGE
ncbi:CCA tRNA nucleotidyltransferase [Helicobacter jaachi]|uniref:CCA tRNA nucleotidyltransferase n=1 Tax=Helicobacter jaachi TaxID=1677920 RepID=A0A4U8T7Z4_9HELI|nr:CCA tRNA nucleotidyltransferase [Helicobacter jaachi]TLD95761.1 CCA tRNA nucleotidyltransferase [Helicobacter jaachi]